uniref:Galactose-3-O-sulfotransferase 2 n=1 Tax=Salarias fasciatus TaxID=181472 RepID=A0A672H958_SALFA
KINNSLKGPRPQNEGPPPPRPQQNFRRQQDHEPTAGNGSGNGLLERGKQNLPKTCRPKSHIVFLKTHKTASSTVQNILFRYGESRELIFVLPPKNKHMLSYPRYFDRKFVETKHLKKFDIICNHMRFRKSEVKKLMPKDSFYFSILRHPVSSMESIFMFFNHRTVFHSFTSLDDFLEHSWNNVSVKDRYAHNNVAFDFGFGNTATADTPDLETIVNKVIAGIERDFHLILITEYFEESMILLKHALCWSLEDVVSFKVNSRTAQSHSSISLTAPEKIKRWNVLDWRIYEHFNATFWNKVRSQVGEEQMKLEVFQLKQLQVKLTSSCLEGAQAVDSTQIKDKELRPFHNGSAVIQGYNLHPNLDIQTKIKCQRMIIPELQYTRRLYVKQFTQKTSKVIQENH